MRFASAFKIRKYRYLWAWGIVNKQPGMIRCVHTYSDCVWKRDEHPIVIGKGTLFCVVIKQLMFVTEGWQRCGVQDREWLRVLGWMTESIKVGTIIITYAHKKQAWKMCVAYQCCGKDVKKPPLFVFRRAL